MRSQLDSLRSVKQRLDALVVFSDADPDYLEMKDDLLKQLSDIYGALRKNISSMERMNQQLEELSAKASRQQDDFSHYRQEMFERVSIIYERRIKPTLSFLNETTRLSDGENLFSIINDCKDMLDNRGQSSTAQQVFLFSISLTNIYKPITKLSAEVERFLQKTRHGILESNAMEAAYQKLLLDHKQTQSENMGKKFMEKGLAQEAKFVLGLKKHPRPQSYRFGHSESYLANFHIDIQNRLEAIKQFKLMLPPDDGKAGKDLEANHRMMRAENIYQLLSQVQFKETDDFVVMMHYLIKPYLDGYKFTDLLTALFHFSQQYHGGEKGFVLRTTNMRKQIQYDGESYVYRMQNLSLAKG